MAGQNRPQKRHAATAARWPGGRRAAACGLLGADNHPGYEDGHGHWGWHPPVQLISVAIAALVGMVLLASPAHADTAQDARFLEEAAKHGFGSYNGSGHLLDMAHGVCMGLGELPTSWENINVAVDVIQQQNPALTREGATEFVTIAVGTYCPWEIPVKQPTTTAATATSDLNLSVPMSQPACDMTTIVVLGNAITPGRYAEDVQRLLDANPGSSYLRTEQSCPSLNQESEDGNPIYAVYRVSGGDYVKLCRDIEAAGSGAYGRMLTTTGPLVFPCTAGGPSP